MRYHKPPICCSVCGKNTDYSYIVYEGYIHCTECFSAEIKEYVEKEPFLLAEEMGLDILRVPEI